MKYIYILVFFVLLQSGSSFCQKFVPDTTVNSLLKIEDYKSIEENLGDIMEKVNHDAPLPDVYFTNVASNRYLRLIFFPGGTRNGFSRFEIGIKPTNKKYPVLKEYSDFKTESNISIGNGLKYLIAKKGNGYKKRIMGSVTIISYEISDISKHPFLQRYNMPSYSAEYFFRKGKLIKMSFGFDYP